LGGKTKQVLDCNGSRYIFSPLHCEKTLELTGVSFIRLTVLINYFCVTLKRTMYLTRKLLIQICDQFLDGAIGKGVVQNFAWNCLASDETDWDENDEVISELLADWDDEKPNLLINRANMKVWKERLLNRTDKPS